MMSESSRFALQGKDSKLIVGDLIPGTDRQILFITGFLSKRWGNKSRALADLCRQHNWGYCCFDFRGNGDSEGMFNEYSLSDWLDDARRVSNLIAEGPPLTIIGSSLGGWLAWILGQELTHIRRLLLLAPAFNMMGKHANDISHTRREQWQQIGWMPWADDAAHRNFPLSWKWVEESETLWAQRFDALQSVQTTIMHGLQDSVIPPLGSWQMTEYLLSQDPQYPIELLLKTGDHRFSSPSNLKTFLDVANQITAHTF
ncbi:MAG: alpha/beta hydrolase [Nitrospirales bacterium]